MILALSDERNQPTGVIEARAPFAWAEQDGLQILPKETSRC